jgi:tetratricopeptide (TPR) repeat protein
MPRCPVNRQAGFLVAAALISLLGAGLAAPGWAAQGRGDDDAAHDRCVALVHSNPKAGLDRAELWRSEGGGFAADHCVAMALYELGRYGEAARRFEELAAAMMAMPKSRRAQTLDQAGQSWLAADDAAQAKADFDAALALTGEDPDLLIDRAEAFAALRHYWEAIDDLNRVTEIAPKRADAYIYLGSAYRAVDALDLALEDIERGLALEPDSVLGLLERGNTRRLRGDATGARQDWQRVIALAPTTAAAAAAKVNLDRFAADSGKPPEDAGAKGKGLRN